MLSNIGDKATEKLLHSPTVWKEKETLYLYLLVCKETLKSSLKSDLRRTVHRLKVKIANAMLTHRRFIH